MDKSTYCCSRTWSWHKSRVEFTAWSAPNAWVPRGDGVVLGSEHELDSVSDGGGDGVGAEGKATIWSNNDLLGSSEDRCRLHQCKGGWLGEMHVEVGKIVKE